MGQADVFFGGALTRGGSNPIVRNGPSSGQYDSTKAGPNDVAKVAAGDYRMWYEAIKDDASATTTVAYATSTDGTAWTKYASNPVMAPSGWENDEVSPNTVFWDTTDLVWKMWYHAGVTAGTGTRKIGYATSADGLTWSKSGSNPILSNGGGGTWDESGVVEPKVIKFGPSDYRMWYRGFDASNVKKIGYATSTDGVSWTKYGSNPVFQAGTAGQWDDGEMWAFCPLYDGSIFHAWYIGDDGSPTTQAIGYAYSLNGTTWVRGPDNPKLSNLGGANVYSPTDNIRVYRDGDRVRIVFGDYDLGASPVKRALGEAYFDGVLEPTGALIDDFNRADDATPPPGTNWTNGGPNNFTAGEGLAIVSNQVTRKSSGSFRQGGYWNVQDFGPDVFVIADVTEHTVSGFAGFSLYGRLKDLAASTTDGYGIDYDQSGATVSLLRYTNAAGTTIASNVTLTLAVGDQTALECTGSTIAFWHKPTGGIWLRRSFATDTTYPLAGKVAIEFNDGQNIKLDNLSIGPAQTLRPDADITTTGWATAPLFSKINEASADGTVITATAA